MTFSVTNWTRLVMPGLFSFRAFGYLVGRLSRMLRRQPRPHRENGLWKIPLRPRIAFARFMEQSAQIAPARVWIRSFPLAGRAARWLHRNQTGWRDRSRMPVPLPASFRKRREVRLWCFHQRAFLRGAALSQHWQKLMLSPFCNRDSAAGQNLLGEERVSAGRAQSAV